MERAVLKFTSSLATASTSDACWKALQDMTFETVGAKLFTVMTVDMARLEAKRAYTSDPVHYPVSGTKPITFDSWFDVVHRQHRLFVANTLADIALVFPDHALIAALGCGAVVNLPILVADELVATINILHVAHYFTPERVAFIEHHLAGPSLAAYRKARA